MALIVEDGSGVANANTYANLTTIRAFCSARGLSIPADDGEAEIQVMRAMDFLEAREGDFRGARVDTEQALSWPRWDDAQVDDLVTLDNGVQIAQDSIPPQLIAALSQLSADASEDILPNTTGSMTIEEKVGPLTTKYASPADGGDTGELKTFRKFEMFISPLLKPRAARISSVRV